MYWNLCIRVESVSYTHLLGKGIGVSESETALEPQGRNGCFLAMNRTQYILDIFWTYNIREKFKLKAAEGVFS